jgi:hypothetical protein
MEQSLSLAQRQAFEGLPAEQKQQYIENLRSTQATALSQLSDRKAGLAGVAQTQQSATEGYRNLLAMDATAKQQNIQRYQQQLETMAGYQDLAYQTNELQPWQRQVEYGRAQQGAGLQNVFGAASGLAQAYAYGQGLNQQGQTSPASGADMSQGTVDISHANIQGLNANSSLQGKTSFGGTQQVSPLGGTQQWGSLNSTPTAPAVQSISDPSLTYDPTNPYLYGKTFGTQGLYVY